MSIVRQLPQLYLRGSIANITMKSLTEEQKRIVSDVTNKVAMHPALTPHRIKFCNQLGNTIGGDYNDDRFANGKLRTNAEQEYLIVIWKATVILLYHQKYAYKCLACNEDKYTTQKSRITPFDRQWDVCPNCKCVRITDSKSTVYQNGTYVNINDLKSIKGEQPEHESPIEVTAIEAKYEDPDKVLNNDDELKRFYGEYIWGYFKQVINLFVTGFNTHWVAGTFLLPLPLIIKVLAKINVMQTFQVNWICIFHYFIICTRKLAVKLIVMCDRKPLFEIHVLPFIVGQHFLA